MFKHTALTCAVAALLAGPALASDEPGTDGILPSAEDVFTKWGETETYTIYADQTKGSCLAERVDEVNNVLQMGLSADREFGYLGVFTQNPIEALEDGDPIVLSLDGEIFEAEARTKTSNLPDGYQGGYVLTNNPAFVEAVQRKYEMIVFPEDEFAFTISLDGTFDAIEELRKCQAELAG